MVTMIQRMLLLGLLLAAVASAPAQNISLEDLKQAGTQILDEYSVDDLLENLETPSTQEWSEFWESILDALQTGSLDDLSWILPYAETAVGFLKNVPEGASYASWMEQRLDYFDMARSVLKAVPSPTPEIRPPVERAEGRFHLAPPSRPRTAPPGDGQPADT